MSWKIYRNEGRDSEHVFTLKDADKAFVGIINAAYTEANHIAQEQGLSTDESQYVLNRVLPMYSMYNSRSGIEIYSCRFLIHQNYNHFVKTYIGLLGAIKDQIGDEKMYEAEWFVFNKDSGMVAVSNTLKSMLKQLASSSGLQPYKSLALFEISSLTEGMVIRCHIRKLRGKGSSSN